MESLLWVSGKGISLAMNKPTVVVMKAKVDDKSGARFTDAYGKEPQAKIVHVEDDREEDVDLVFNSTLEVMKYA